jgi:hypothetical protein
MTKDTIPYIFLLLLAFLLINATAAPARADVNSVRPGETVSGRLERSDDQLDDGCYYDIWEIDCEPGTVMTITQSSDDIDCYLIVTGPRDMQWENDDYSFDSLNSRLTVRVGDRRGFEILASSYSQETGRYELELEEIEQPDYYGVFVGIENYGDEWEDAPLCDEDAEQLYEAFVDSGLMDRDNGILLTNRDAEKRDIESAFDEISRRIRPNDVFVFFFSGHGTQVEARGRHADNELDGLDEAICLRDGDLIDDDLAALLDDVQSGLSVVVLDSCNSGGIARDVVNRPGIMCFASSEEDVLSDFAPELDAGGYLSVFFREAISGDGDLDGDGMMLIGELTRFLLRRYYEQGPNSDVAMYGYPELVHDRGLVTQDTVFCWWNDRGRRDTEK